MSDRITFASKITAEGRNIRGAVQIAGQRNRRAGEWLEVDPAAIVRADASKVIGVFEHDDSKLLASLDNDTLTLRRTDQGIEYEFHNLPNTTAANDALELVRGGYVTGSSFQVDGLRFKFSTDPKTGERTRRIVHIDRLVDVSPVRDPFFEASSAAAFSKESEVTEPIPDPIPEPEPPKVPEPEPPKAKFSQGEMTREAAEAFAQGQPTEAIVAFMDNVLAATKGDLSPAQLDQYEGFASVLAERKRADATSAERIERMKALHDMRLGRIPKAPEGNETFASDGYREAFNKYLHGTPNHGLEAFALSIAGDGSQGGYTVPDGFWKKITERLKAYGGIAGVADEITTSTGESLRWPYVDDTANSAAIVAEGVAGTAGADKVFSSIELGAYSYDANGAGNLPLKVSLELLQDSAFDLEAFISKNLATRIGRKQADDLANGTGVGEPFGLFSKAADAMTATVVSLAAPEHIMQVDSAYRDGGNCRWVMSDTTLAKVWTSQTTTNQPLFVPGGSDIVGRFGGSLYGFPITIDAAAGNLVAFGDIRAGYIIRRVRGVQLLVDPYTAQSTRQVAYHAWARMDANVQDPNAYSVSSWAGVSADT